MVDPELLGIAVIAGGISTILSAGAATLHAAAWVGGKQDAGPKVWMDVGATILGVTPIGFEAKIARAAITPEAKDVTRAIVNYGAGARGGALGIPGLIDLAKRFGHG